MCRRIQCEQCHKPTFDGCGKHAEQVLRGVTEADRCQCKRQSGTQLAAVRNANSTAQAGQISRP
jgi:hypothetical protein